MLNKDQSIGDFIKADITLRHTHSHGDIREYAENAVQMLRKYDAHITTCRVILDHQKHTKAKNKISEIIVTSMGKAFVSKSAAETYEKAIDKCVSAVSRQIKEHKRIQQGI